jgi:putative SOS response-associated peptidase YedK
MCGRFAQYGNLRTVARRFVVDASAFRAEDGPPRFSIAPAANIPVVRLDSRGRGELVRLKRGLVATRNNQHLAVFPVE